MKEKKFKKIQKEIFLKNIEKNNIEKKSKKDKKVKVFKIQKSKKNKKEKNFFTNVREIKKREKVQKKTN